MLPLLAIQAAGAIAQGISGRNAAAAQQRAAQQQAAMQAQQQAQTRADFQPYMGLGQGALGRMAAVDGGDFSAFEQSPDFQFAMQQAMQANDRSAAARGSLFSGGADADRMQMAQGLASQNLQNYLGRMMQQAQMGQSAAGSVGSIGAGLMGAQAGAVGAQGQARAAGFGAISGAVGQIGSALGGFMGGRAQAATPTTTPVGGVWGFGGTGGIGAGLAGGTRYAPPAGGYFGGFTG